MKINFDDALKERLLSGEEEAFVTTVEICKDLVYGSALRILKNKEDAEDVTQDVFILLYKKRTEISAESNIPVWLYTSSVFVSKRIIGRKVTAQNYKPSIEDMCVSVENNDENLSEVVLEELDKLPKNHREILFLHYVLGHKHKDIALSKGLKLSAVGMKIKRGVNVLKANLSKKGYVVSAVIVISAMSSGESLIANTTLSTNAIVSASKSYCPKIYRPAADSSAFKSYCSTPIDSTINSRIILGIVALVVACFSLYFFMKSPAEKIQESVAIKKKIYEGMIWSGQKNNLSQLKSSNGLKITLLDPISKKKKLSNYSEDSAYIPLPTLLPNVPVKISLDITLRKDSKFVVGLYLAKGNTPMNYTSYPSARLKPFDIGKVRIFLLDKTKIIMINSDVISVGIHDQKLEGLSAILRLRHFETSEIKMTGMSTNEIKKAKTIILSKKNKVTTKYRGSPLPTRLIGSR